MYLYEVDGVKVHTKGIDRLDPKRFSGVLKSMHMNERIELEVFLSQGGVLFADDDISSNLAYFTFAKYGGQRVPVIGINSNLSELPKGTFHHEFTHYLQWLRGDLEYREDSEGKVVSYWKGERIDRDRVESDIGYYFHTPWEQEAFLAQYQWVAKNYSTVIPAKVKLRVVGANAKLNSFIQKLVGGGEC